MRRLLADALERPVYLKINQNSHNMISAKRDGTGPGIRVSLHFMFLKADKRALKALIQFLKNPTPRSRGIIRDYIADHDDLIGKGSKPTSSRRIKGTPVGKTYHLLERARHLNESCFDGQLEYRIIWGRNVRVNGRQRHVTLGTWNPRQKIIRIHPMLDSESVPLYYLDFVIFHEMTHIAVPSSQSSSGRAVHHSAEFYKIERSYPLYSMAMAWEKKWLPKLISAWNQGKPLSVKSNDFFPLS